MSVNLRKGLKDSNVTMGDMKDGQIAVIIDATYEGEVVQCINGYGFIVIGSTKGQAWTSENPKPGINVRLLEKGEILVIDKN